MTKSSLLISFGLAILVAQPGAAQRATPAPRPYYLGLGGVVGNYQPTIYHSNSVLAPQLVGGRRFSSRLALEAGLFLYHDRTEQSGTGLYHADDPNASYQPVIFRNVYQRRTQALTLTARYALLRRTERRLQLDALLGAALVHADAYGFNSALDQATREVLALQYYSRYDITGGCALAGPSVRYRLNARLELTGEYVANFAFAGRTPTDVSRLSGTVSLSARYCFGAPLPAADYGGARRPAP